MSEEKVFADGFVFKGRNENAPEFVIGQVSVKVDEAIAFLRQHVKNGWVNLEIKQARSGSYYMELNTFEPKPKGDAEPKAAVSKPSKPSRKQEEEENLPF